ncbi:MAG: hypothetical protein R3C97_03390 [Geminicoccaceae bacterium]
MTDKPWSTEQRWHFAGWLLFIASAVLFIWSSWKSGDLVALLASLAFLVACFVFLVPFFLSADGSGDSP